MGLRILGYLFFCFIIFVLLTIITQVGGIVLVLLLIIKRKYRITNTYKVGTIFLSIYLICTLFVTPRLAAFMGRERISHQYGIRPSNYATVLFNRNYVTPALNNLLIATARSLLTNNQPISIRYLDACFPFGGMPLLPHLSHYDGRKVDLSFIYQDDKGTTTTKRKSISGYGVYEHPRSDEIDQVSKCLLSGHRQYDYTKYITFGSINKALQFSEPGNRQLINTILKQPILEKIFIEPHIKQRLRLNNDKIRYHGCTAVRHDDHIHIQVY